MGGGGDGSIASSPSPLIVLGGRMQQEQHWTVLWDSPVHPWTVYELLYFDAVGQSSLKIMIVTIVRWTYNLPGK